jgi:hypothetical protein
MYTPDRATGPQDHTHQERDGSGRAAYRVPFFRLRGQWPEEDTEAVFLNQRTENGRNAVVEWTPAFDDSP